MRRKEAKRMNLIIGPTIPIGWPKWPLPPILY